MKRIFAILALLVCGLEIGCSTSKQQQTPSPFFYGQYTGTMTGTNFTDQTLILGFSSSSTGLTVSANIGGDTTPTLCDGGGWGGQSVIVTSGLSFSGSGSSVSGNSWTFSINGTEASGGQSLNGTITFSAAGCGTATDPWTGTFTATAVPGS
jgi:hypothetical protein